jgi:mRNA interferase MazF
VRQGDIWLCTLDPTVGSEIRKTRPCVIISPDDLNERLHTVIVAPMTSGGRPARFRVEVAFRGVSGLILPDQMRALDRQRLVKRLGAVDQQTIATVLTVCAALFAPASDG